MADMVLQVVMAAVGALGFGLLFRISGGRLVTILLGGAANWVFYLLAMYVYADRVLAFFLAALATAALAEVLARLLKTPVITLLVPMLVPLIPGGDLYYTTFALVQGDAVSFAHYGSLVIREAGAISLASFWSPAWCRPRTASGCWRGRERYKKAFCVRLHAERFLCQLGQQHQQIGKTPGDRRPDQSGQQHAHHIQQRKPRVPQAAPKLVWLAERLKRPADRFVPAHPAAVVQFLRAGQDMIGQLASYARAVRRPIQVDADLVEKMGNALIRGHRLHLRPPCRTDGRMQPIPAGIARAF